MEYLWTASDICDIIKLIEKQKVPDNVICGKRKLTVSLYLYVFKILFSKTAYLL